MPQELETLLHSTLVNLIETKGINKFYVGNHGGFDSMVHDILKELSNIYSIEYIVVLAYVPSKKRNSNNKIFDKSILPDGIESVPPKFAINWRNKWMLNRADYVVTYVQYPFGGAARFKELAEKQDKIVINLKTE